MLKISRLRFDGVSAFVTFVMPSCMDQCERETLTSPLDKRQKPRPARRRQIHPEIRLVKSWVAIFTEKKAPAASWIAATGLVKSGLCRAKSGPCHAVSSQVRVSPHPCRAVSSPIRVSPCRAVSCQIPACQRVRVMSAPP